MWIGVRWLRRKGDADSDPKQEPEATVWWAVAGVTMANGADNLGVYIPAFASQTDTKNVITGVSFLILTLVWCAVAWQLVRHPTWGSVVQHWSRKIAPFVLILIGLWIVAHHPIFGIWPAKHGS
jgi:cadmium resistance protein CadD (predicted permease)